MPRLLRNGIVRVLLVALAVVLLTALVALLAREPIRQYLADVTGEEDPAYQYRALGFLALSLFQPPVETADFAPVRYNDYSPFGVNTAFEPNTPDLEARLRAMQEAGIKWGRQDFTWKRIEKAKGEYDWEPYDGLVERCRQTGGY